MPNPYLIIFELLMYSLLLWSARHAWRSGGLPTLLRLLAGVAFGVLLEWGTILQLDAYEYGQFLVMLGEVPLAIGVGWGLILYSAMQFSDATSLPPALRPVLDALLALNIDLAMDAVAIRLGMWQWGIGTTAEYFGVPYANFWAWFWVVSSFSAGVRSLSHRGGWPGRWLAPVGGIAFGLLVVLSMNRVITRYIPAAFYLPVVLSVIGLALALVLLAKPQVDRSSVPPLATWVPLGFHLYFLIAGLASGVFLQIPALLLISLLMTLIALLLHRPGHSQTVQT